MRRSVGALADPVPGGAVVADPEVPGGDAVEWRVRGAARIGTPEEGAVPPDDLRVVAADLSGRAGVRGVVVVRPFRGPGLHHLGDARPVPRRARRDVLPEVPAACVVL